MIFTSYFGKLSKLPPDVIPISICGKAPDWYTGLQYKKLAPKYQFFMEWKRTHDNAYYIEHFEQEVLAQLNADTVFEELSALSGGQTFALICYERPGDFCHRHLVANWFCKNGYRCEEIDI